MKIGLAGYFGFGSYTDDLIASGIINAFDGNEIRVLPLGEGDYRDLGLVILGGGSLLGGLEHADLVRGLMASDVPFCILGTGFRNEAFPRVTRFLLERSFKTVLRGKKTVENLHRIGIKNFNVDCLGDSIFLLEATGLPKEPKIVSCIRDGNKTMIENLEKFSGHFKMPAELLMFNHQQGDLGTYYPIGKAYTKLSTASYIFTNRLHVLCVGLINGIPSLGTEIEFNKVEDSLSTLMWPHWLHGYDDFDRAFSEFIKSNDTSEVVKRINGVCFDLKAVIDEIKEVTKCQ